MSPRGRRRGGTNWERVDGVLVVDKPTGPTSFDVVRRVRRMTRAAKIGHAGTLDPMATGLLVVCMGEATKTVPWLMDAPKSYRTTMKLGVATDTYDAEGNVTAETAVPALDVEAIEAVLGRFRGGYDQVPPAWSAIRKDGQRSHDIVRRGGEVVHDPRPVQVHELKLVRLEAPELEVEVRCGKGFYVRSLAHDIGEALGCGAHLTALRRTSSAHFNESDARSLEALEEGWQDALVSAADALTHLPAVTLDEKAEAVVRNGGPVEAEGDGFVRALDAGGRLVAVMKPDERQPGWLRPERVLLPQ